MIASASSSSAKHTTDGDTHEILRVDETFRKIEVQPPDPKKTGKDDWLQK